MKKILMCPPDFFSISYEINPWMDVDNQVDPHKARMQWQALYDLYVANGIKVELLTPVEGLPDMVFTANGGLVKNDTFVSGNFRFQERKPEEQHFQKWFKDHGYTVQTLNHFQGGEGDALFFRDTLYMGYGFRSERESHDEIQQLLNVPVVSLHLVDPYFYDFDMTFCPVGDKAVLYYPAAFDEESQQILCSTPDAIPITRMQAQNFIGNSVYLNGTLLTSYMDVQLKKTLQSLHVDYTVLDMSEFKKSGGGIKCLTLYLG